MTRRYDQFSLVLWEFLFGNADQVDALSTSELDHGDIVFFRDFGNTAQLLRRGNTAIDTGHNAKGRVFLDVSVYAVVNEASVALILIIFAPDGLEQRAQADLATRIFFPSRQGLKDGRDTAQVLLFNGFDEFRFLERNTRDVVVDRGIFDNEAIRGQF